MRMCVYAVLVMGNDERRVSGRQGLDHEGLICYGENLFLKEVNSHCRGLSRGVS